MRRPIAARLLRSESGMTLAELIMGAFIGLVVLGVMFGAMAVQGRSATYQAGLADAQISGRNAGEILQQDLRMAGFGMLGVSPPPNGLPPLEFTQNAGVTTLTLRGAFRNVQSTLMVAAAKNATSISVDPPTMGGVFEPNQQILIDSGLNSEMRTISSVTAAGGGYTIGLSTPLAFAYPIGPNVTQIERVIYTYDGTILRRDSGAGAQVVADRVTTFQLQFVSQGGTVSNTPGDDLRSVTLNLVAAQPTTAPGSMTASSRVATEVNVRNLTFRFDLG